MYTPKDYNGVIPLNAIPEKQDNGSYLFIKRNAAKCTKCGKVIESWRQHDFVRCDCGSIFVDGGLSYLRRGGNPGEYEDLSESGTATEEQYQDWRKAHALLEEYKHKKAYELMRKANIDVI